MFLLNFKDSSWLLAPVHSGSANLSPGHATPTPGSWCLMGTSASRAHPTHGTERNPVSMEVKSE